MTCPLSSLCTFGQLKSTIVHRWCWWQLKARVSKAPMFETTGMSGDWFHWIAVHTYVLVVSKIEGCGRIPYWVVAQMLVHRSYVQTKKVLPTVGTVHGLKLWHYVGVLHLAIRNWKLGSESNDISHGDLQASIVSNGNLCSNENHASYMYLTKGTLVRI